MLTLCPKCGFMHVTEACVSLTPAYTMPRSTMSTITAKSLRQIAKDARAKMLDGNYLRVLDYARERAFSGYYVGRVSVPSCVVEDLCVKLETHGFATRQTSDGAGANTVSIVISWDEE